MPDQPSRLYLCARCHCQVLVCSRCDRGQRYCATGCATITRQSRQREAGRRYQQSRAGRHKHAAHTHRWRQRPATSANKVTHQGSLPTPGDAVLPAIASPPAIPPDSSDPPPCSPSVSASLLASPSSTAVFTPVWSCHWCRTPCPALVRQGFLHHHRRVDHGHYP